MPLRHVRLCRLVVFVLLPLSLSMIYAHSAPPAPPDIASSESSLASLDSESRVIAKALANTQVETTIIPIDSPRIDARLLHFGADEKKALNLSSHLVFGKSAPVANGTISQTQLQVRRGRVRIDAVAKDDGIALQNEFLAMGMQRMSVNGRNVSGDLPVEAMRWLSLMKNLRFVRPSTAPETRSGSAVSQGDVVQKSNVARANFGVNGRGTKIGILSDSYNYLGGAAGGVATGDLPGIGNPNGFTAPVKVLKDFGNFDEPGSDEGRAMAEILHDVAPGAALSFYTAFESAQDFAKGIAALADDGAKVVVDDVVYFSEPWFQDGVIAQAVKNVAARGVTYFSAAGNSGRASYESFFLPVSGVTSLARFDGTRFGDYELHNFLVDGKALPYQRLTLAAGRNSTIFLQWDEPFASASAASPGAASDLDVFLMTVPGDFNSIVASSTFNNLGGDAFDGLTVFFNGPLNATADVYLVIGRPIVRLTGDPVDARAGRPRFLKTLFSGGVVDVDASFNRKSTVIGQANAADAMSVCAVNYFEADVPGGPKVANFSSQGGTPILFTPDGRRTFEFRLKPDICAPNGGNTTFFFPGDDYEGDGKPNFFGTSASAPHAAGVAALMLQASKNRLSPFFITNLLRTTATDMDDPNTTQFDRGFDFRTGFGFINAQKAVQQASYFGFF
jgi:subtilisin family serine protease